jgi:hypothetical protein
MEHMPGHKHMGAKNSFRTLFIMCTRKGQVLQICEHKLFIMTLPRSFAHLHYFTAKRFFWF